MKRFLKAVLSCCLVSMLSVVNINDAKALDNGVTLRELVKSGEIDLKSLDMQKEYSLDAATAAVVSIYSSSNGPASSTNTSGHSWIVIDNYSTSRNYGSYVVGANQSISMGTWGNKGYNGIWYNLESSYRTSYPSNQTFYAKTVLFTDEIDSFRNALPGLNLWSLTKNCSTFAVRAWNNTGATNISLASVETPSTLMNKINSISGARVGTSESDFVNASKNVQHY